MNRNLFTIIVASLLLTACDPQGQPAAQSAGAVKDNAAPAKPDADAAPDAAGAPGAAGAADAAPAPEGSLSTCLQACDDSKASPTDLATCRLQCDSVYRRLRTDTVAGDHTDPVGDAASCLGRCYSLGGATDSCAAGCKASAAAAPVAPSAAVLDALSTCIGTCHADKKSIPTNRATCELNCAQEAHIAGPVQPPR